MSRVHKEEYHFVPRTWVLPGEYNTLCYHIRELKQRRRHKTFIIKPHTGAMGNGWASYLQLCSQLCGSPNMYVLMRLMYSSLQHIFGPLNWWDPEGPERSSSGLHRQGDNVWAISALWMFNRGQFPWWFWLGMWAWERYCDKLCNH